MRRDTDPVLNYRFVLELGFVQVAGFSECTGLSQETKVMEYKEGGRNHSPIKLPEGGGTGNITLKRGVVTGSSADALFKWHRDVMHGEFDDSANPNKRKTSTEEDIDKRCAIVLQNEAGEEVRRWNLRRAFPVKWSGPDLKAMASEVALETLELCHEGLELG
jgi:phage tail-like protein